MCGFVFGLFCVGLAAIAYRRHRRRFWACAHGGHGGHGGFVGHGHWGGHHHHWHGGDCGHHHDHGGGGARWSTGVARGVAAGLSEAVLATPEQERVIQGAFAKVADAKANVHATLRGMRGQAAQAFREDDMSEEALGAAIAEAEAAFESVRRALVDALVEVHGALDRGQRERLARWIEHAPWNMGPFGRGRYRY